MEKDRKSKEYVESQGFSKMAIIKLLMREDLELDWFMQDWGSEEDKVKLTVVFGRIPREADPRDAEIERLRKEAADFANKYVQAERRAKDAYDEAEAQKAKQAALAKQADQFKESAGMYANRLDSIYQIVRD